MAARSEGEAVACRDTLTIGEPLKNGPIKAPAEAGVQAEARATKKQSA
jgi:hypothetical protein